MLALTATTPPSRRRWNADPGTDPTYGVPTSYYTAVQLLCRAEVVDDPDEKAAILAVQLGHFEPADSRSGHPDARRSRATAASCPASAACG